MSLSYPSLVTITLAFLLLFLLSATSALTVPINTDPSSYCHQADFDYSLEEVDNGFIVTFFDQTANAFVAYTNLLWSTVVSDDKGQPVSSGTHTVRLKRSSRDSFSVSLSYDAMKAQIGLDNNAMFLLNDDNLKLKFFFNFWLVSEDGDRQEMCQSPVYIV